MKKLIRIAEYGFVTSGLYYLAINDGVVAATLIFLGFLLAKVGFYV